MKDPAVGGTYSQATGPGASGFIPPPWTPPASQPPAPPPGLHQNTWTPPASQPPPPPPFGPHQNTAPSPPPPPGLDQNTDLATEQWKARTYTKIQRHLNIGWMRMSAYEARFGEISRGEPWGCHFWDGMMQALDEYQWPKQASPTGRGYFETPHNFSKEAAKRAKCPVSNPGGGQKYATFIWRIGQCEIWIACQWLLLTQSRPWRVDETWIEEL